VARPFGVEAAHEAEDQPGEHLLFAAVAKRLIEDIRHPRPISGPPSRNGATSVLDQLTAVEWLVDDHGGLQAWAELLGLDASYMRAQLLCQAGLADLARQHTPLS
jgi:hypothetical protein